MISLTPTRPPLLYTRGKKFLDTLAASGNNSFKSKQTRHWWRNYTNDDTLLYELRRPITDHHANVTLPFINVVYQWSVCLFLGIVARGRQRCSNTFYPDCTSVNNKITTEEHCPSTPSLKLLQSK